MKEAKTQKEHRTLVPRGRGLGWSDFGSITKKEQRNIRQIRHSKKTKVT
jgi:hypothetical protein